MNKIIIDLDGTLLKSDKTISKQTIKTINKLKNMGKDIILATARPPRGVYRYLPQELLKGKIIFYNGAEIHNKGKAIYSQNIKSSDLKTIHKLVQEYSKKTAIGYEYKDQLYAIGSFEKHFPKILYKEVKSFLYRDTPKILIDIVDNPFKKYILNSLPSDCGVVFTDNDSLAQVMHKTVSKRNAVQYLLNKYEDNFENVICFGDDYNDIELFEECKISVAMENAINELKEASTHITRSNDEDGVASFLNKYFS